MQRVLRNFCKDGALPRTSYKRTRAEPPARNRDKHVCTRARLLKYLNLTRQEAGGNRMLKSQLPNSNGRVSLCIAPAPSNLNATRQHLVSRGASQVHAQKRPSDTQLGREVRPRGGFVHDAVDKIEHHLILPGGLRQHDARSLLQPRTIRPLNELIVDQPRSRQCNRPLLRFLRVRHCLRAGLSSDLRPGGGIPRGRGRRPQGHKMRHGVAAEEGDGLLDMFLREPAGDLYQEPAAGLPLLVRVQHQGSGVNIVRNSALQIRLRVGLGGNVQTAIACPAVQRRHKEVVEDDCTKGTDLRRRAPVSEEVANALQALTCGVLLSFARAGVEGKVLAQHLGNVSLQALHPRAKLGLPPV
mmetsp:Transcript_46421/g.149150  ORF Transcript_46421/g.149150 Transcript_46421/m.149150 type:complete len:356 (+) Transcript_46421:222-1289(+)